MEGGFPMLNCPLQLTLRSLCSCSNASSSKWVYAVFWRILPRNYPPPRWDYGGTALDRSKGNKRNWILVWEDGFCDFYECERAGSGYMKGRFGADVFFKMSHEVYNYGEGLVGKVAADDSHKWVFRKNPNENDPNFVSSWNTPIEPQPRAWEFQFSSGIQTIAIISVREGVIQLGSLDKMSEDLNLVISVQRKFGYLQSIPGVFAIQRPYLPIQHPYILKPGIQMIETQQEASTVDDKRYKAGVKRLFDDRPYDSPIKSINLGWNSPQNGITGSPILSVPPLLPSMSGSLGALLSKLPSVLHSHSNAEALDTVLVNSNHNSRTTRTVKTDDCVAFCEDQLTDTIVEASCHLGVVHGQNPQLINPSLGSQDGAVPSGPLGKGESSLSLN
uniref:Transcription factor MYC/MYB N-terminal domain-containing protein n=2 Tax=Rhizophora mucronata TaxID=61149 RepID=A0A2P2KB18_RHIMU